MLKLIPRYLKGYPILQQLSPVIDNTRYVRPYNSIEIAESKKAYEQEQLQKLIEAAQKRLPLLKADTRSDEQRQRDYNRAIQLEVKQKANELAANFGRALGANHDLTVDEVNQNTLNTVNLMGYMTAPYLMTTLESGYYGATGRPKEAALTAGVGYGLPIAFKYVEKLPNFVKNQVTNRWVNQSSRYNNTSITPSTEFNPTFPEIPEYPIYHKRVVKTYTTPDDNYPSVDWKGDKIQFAKTPDELYDPAFVKSRYFEHKGNPDIETAKSKFIERINKEFGVDVKDYSHKELNKVYNSLTDNQKQQFSNYFYQFIGYNNGTLIPYSLQRDVIRQGIEFGRDYFLSPGYLERFNNMVKLHGSFPLQKNVFAGNDLVTWTPGWENANSNLRFGLFDVYRPHFRLGETGTHEVFHWNRNYNTRVSSSSGINLEKPSDSPFYNNDYSNIPLRVKQILTPNREALQRRANSGLGDLEHDFELSEQYSDLGALRYNLKKEGIFDSFKSGEKFDLRLLDAFRKTESAKTDRFIDLHDDLQIIDAINEIAQNNTSDRINYAAKGVKLIPRHLKGNPIKRIAHTISLHGDRQTYKLYSFDDFKKYYLRTRRNSYENPLYPSDKLNWTIQAENRARQLYLEQYGENYPVFPGPLKLENYIKIFDKVLKEYYDQYLKDNPTPEITNSLTAAKFSILGSGMALIPHPITRISGTLLMVPDYIYDAALAIDEPKPSNIAHNISDYAPYLGKAIPGQYDDLLLHSLNLIGNADDAASVKGNDIFSFLNPKQKTSSKKPREPIPVSERRSE